MDFYSRGGTASAFGIPVSISLKTAVASVFLLNLFMPAQSSAGQIIGKDGVPYSDNSPFVQYPADLVGGVAVVPGYLLTALFVCPFHELKGFETSARDWNDCAARGAIYSGGGGMIVGGAPFFVLEELIWELPRAALRKSSQTPRTGTVANGKVIWDEKK